MNAPVLSRSDDVAAALRDPRLVPTAVHASAAAPLDKGVHAEFRARALGALAPAAIEPWEASFRALADELAAGLPAGEPVDLIARYATPYSLGAAAVAAEVPADAVVRLAAIARPIFDSACEPYERPLAEIAQRATVELANVFHAAPPWTVQMFAALALSLPALLGNAWFALAERHPDGADMDKLLRTAGPAKVVFRRALEPLNIGDCNIARDQIVILRLDGDSQLAFGLGTHACVGAGLVRSAAGIATQTLLDRFAIGEEFTAVPAEHFAMRYLRSLVVRLSIKA